MLCPATRLENRKEITKKCILAGVFATYVAAPPLTALAGVCGAQHASSARGGRAATLENHVQDDLLGERRNTREISIDNIHHGQATCPETLYLREVLDQVPGARLSHWAEKEGLVPTLRDGVPCMENEDGSLLLIHVPVVLRVGVIQRVHFGRYLGHFGKKTIRGIRTRFLWGLLSSAVKKILRTCIHCWSQSRGVLKSQVPLGELPLGWPGDILAMDFFGPLPTTMPWARDVLVCIDHFSRWVELAALSRLREEEVMAFLRDIWIPHHGVPKVVLSDNGPQFIAEVLRSLCGSIGARTIYRSPCYPQGDSVELSVREAYEDTQGSSKRLRV